MEWGVVVLVVILSALAVFGFWLDWSIIKFLVNAYDSFLERRGRR